MLRIVEAKRSYPMYKVEINKLSSPRGMGSVRLCEAESGQSWGYETAEIQAIQEPRSGDRERRDLLRAAQRSVESATMLSKSK